MGSHQLNQRPPANLRERARVAGNPVIEGGLAWFVWSGEKPVKLHGDFTDWYPEQAIELQPAGEDLWAACFEFTPDAYLEYTFMDGEKRLRDPFNPRRTPNGVGHYNQFFYMPEGHPTQLTIRRPGVKAGIITEHRLETGWMLPGSRRALSLYRPPLDEPCPLLLVFDGQDYLKRAKLVTQVENLVALGRVRPLALAMIQPFQPSRMLEYDCSDVTLTFLLKELLPFARHHLNLIDPAGQPGAWGVMGASMGGVMSLYTALRLPELFGNVLSQSGAFEPYGPNPVIFDLIENFPTLPLRIWMDAGLYEWLFPSNRSMSALLEKKGYAQQYREFSGSHNYPSWRDDLSHGLEWLFPASG
jgi:enterochelin esterase-like enzyme